MDDDHEQSIRERAYEIWENEGRPQGRGAEHWEQARMEFYEARQEAAQTRTGSQSQQVGSRGSAQGSEGTGGRSGNVEPGENLGPVGDPTPQEGTSRSTRGR